ncbi:DUF805 domain-containing protein [Neolewinella marina]|uniref:Uncharacterized protein n=1 Tax=Neolewinella marina TaxID=438751 RepID=A0A2G0CH53_9BACT|nr:hypothetical protein [Neolewinella marina]PHK99291.1 hypothetical protein CGL56_07500 [Neolewinella marina]
MGAGTPALLRLFNGYWSGWRRYADFGGRSTVREYLSFLIINASVGFLLAVLGERHELFAGLKWIYACAALVPGLAVTVRVLRALLGTGK